MRNYDREKKLSVDEILKLVMRGEDVSQYLADNQTRKQIMDIIEDIELGRIIEQRRSEKTEATEIDLSDL
jgi:hypothetical protein